jgi:hypothetical protein
VDVSFILATPVFREYPDRKVENVLAVATTRDSVRAQTTRLLKKIRGIWLLEAAPGRMATNHAGTKPYRVLANVGVFHQALRDFGWHHIPGPTYLRVRETPLIADRVVGHAP